MPAQESCNFDKGQAENGIVAPINSAEQMHAGTLDLITSRTPQRGITNNVEIGSRSPAFGQRPDMQFVCWQGGARFGCRHETLQQLSEVGVPLPERRAKVGWLPRRGWSACQACHRQSRESGQLPEASCPGTSSCDCEDGLAFQFRQQNGDLTRWHILAPRRLGEWHPHRYWAGRQITSNPARSRSPRLRGTCRRKNKGAAKAGHGESPGIAVDGAAVTDCDLLPAGIELDHRRRRFLNRSAGDINHRPVVTGKQTSGITHLLGD